MTNIIKAFGFIFFLFYAHTCASQDISKWGTTPPLHTEGNHLVNSDGEQVMLHGIMDTPSPYFCGYRFTDGHWIDVYRDGDKYINKCITYFDKLFTAATDTAQGSWCNVFRLHLDPCWTNDSSIPSTGSDTGEANISQFSNERLKKYLDKLFIPLAEKAQGHGMYVIMRPPGVCPNEIRVNGAYHQYLLKVWDTVSKNETVRNHSGWLSLELANEPIRIVNAQGQETSAAMKEFFQPIVDKIRENGFEGIIWVPGGTWQQNYRPYASYPIEDDNFGYAVHFYPGWYSTSDNTHDAATSIRAFQSSVPVVKTHPIMITEVDWSPENPNGQGHYNESGQWVLPNYGTWATGSTSKFGLAYKAVLDYFGNIGMTITHTHDYMDIDKYLATGIMQPAFTGVMPDTYEACSGACFQWYNEYAHNPNQARDWSSNGSYYFDNDDELINIAADLNGKTVAVTNTARNSFWFVADNLDSPQNVRTGDMDSWGEYDYKYLKFNKVSNPGCTTKGNLYTIQLTDELGSNYSLWGSNGYLNTPPGGWCIFALGLGSKYGQDGDFYGLWKVDYEEGYGYTIQNVGRLQAGDGAYITPSAGTPQQGKEHVRIFSKVSKQTTGIDNAISDNAGSNMTGVYDLMGRRTTNGKGIIIVRTADGKVRKVLKK